METGHDHVAAVALVGHRLKLEHVPIRRSVWCVTAHTTFADGAPMFEHIGSALILVTPDALLLFEAAEKHPLARCVRVVT